MSTYFKYFFTALLTLFVLHNRAAVCTSTGNGAWANASTWSCGSVPACGDSIVIQAGHTVSITSQDYVPCALKMTLVIKGVLRFTAPGKLEFDCLGRVYIFSGAQIIAANGVSGNSNAVMQCGSTWWNAGAGTYNGPGCMPPFLTGCASVLPVELLDFQATPCNVNSVCLDWTTATEHDHKHFEVLRSEDGYDFYELVRINVGVKGLNGQHKYYYEDSEPFEGINYYRLKQVDLNGRFKLYPVIAVKMKSQHRLQFKISPNPNTGDFTIHSAGLPVGETVQVMIYEVTGKIVHQGAFIRESNQSDFFVGTMLEKGLYFCKISSAQAISTLRLIVE